MSTAAKSPLPMQAFLAGARRRIPSLVKLAGQLIQFESPSDNKAAVDACIAFAAARALRIGGRVKIHPLSAAGDALESRFGPPSSPSRGRRDRILLLGHLDTVWPVGTLSTMPFIISGHKLCGPGSLDMKAGVAMAFTALELLLEADLLRHEVVLLLNGDEEIGSGASRSLIERLARQCGAVYVLEPAQGLACKTARKGIGNWRIEVEGRSAHAGVDFEKGGNAIRELARVIETVSGWTNLKRGLTVSVGVARGGTRSNVVPAHACAEVDVRIPRVSDGPRIARKFAALRASLPHCKITVTGGINRPPMERSRGTVRLFRKAQALAHELGFELEEASTGGGSDGNFTAALGVPTLDGMGAVGEGAHAANESVFGAHLAPRTALLAGMLLG